LNLYARNVTRLLHNFHNRDEITKVFTAPFNLLVTCVEKLRKLDKLTNETVVGIGFLVGGSTNLGCECDLGGLAVR
jgi:hypothetical protein